MSATQQILLSGSATFEFDIVISYQNVYQWFNGFGSRFSNPTPTINIGSIYSVDVHPSGSAIVFSGNSSPYITAYRFSKDGFGTKFDDPVVLPTGYSECVKFSPDGNALLVGHANSPYLTAYSWSSSTGFGAKLNGPSVLSGFVRSIAFNGLGDVFFSGIYSPYISAYVFTSSEGFGAKYANPTTLPQGNVMSIDASSTDVVYATTITPYIGGYPFTSGAGFGARYAVGSASDTIGGCVRISPTRGVVVLSNSSTYGNLKFYEFTPGSGFGSKSVSSSQNTLRFEFTPDGNSIILNYQSTPFIRAFKWTDSGKIGAIYSNPATLPTDSPYRITVGRFRKT